MHPLAKEFVLAENRKVGLSKPLLNENVDIEVINTNMDIIDEAIPTEEHINELIDAKLGAIENGSY